MLYVQLPVEVEHSGAAMDSASDLLTVVMGLENALMAVMRLDAVVVSYNSCVIRLEQLDKTVSQLGCADFE